ncbi:MAG: nicotinate (nicotinamide) nucleotide adenylyltransferase [Eubacteriales bacterium]|nr:nicotinate (nicotinamide) nucleotide adenylyltransferase [Eubacteriales bacterium]
MRTGVLGGTFNPPHLGHLHAAQLARDELALDRVLFIPTNIPPHKSLPVGTATTADRCEMVRLMTQGIPWAQLDTIEIERGGASYTVDTLRALRARGMDDLYLIVGTDMLLSFDRGWRDPAEIARLCTLAVCARAEEDWGVLVRKAAALRWSLHARIELIRGASLPISSTALRQGGDLRHYTTAAVADHIERRHLYGYGG